MAAARDVVFAGGEFGSLRNDMKIFAKILVTAAVMIFGGGCAVKPPMRVLVVTSRAKDHLKMIAAATPMLEKMAAENHFVVDITNDDTVINDANLAKYQVFVQLQEAAVRHEAR